MHTLFISSGQQIHNCQKWNRVFSVYVLASGPHWPSCNLKRIVAVKHFFIHIHINNNKNFNINGIAQNTMHLESTILRCCFKWHVLLSAFCVSLGLKSLQLWISKTYSEKASSSAGIRLVDNYIPWRQSKYCQRQNGPKRWVLKGKHLRNETTFLLGSAQISPPPAAFWATASRFSRPVNVLFFFAMF